MHFRSKESCPKEVVACNRKETPKMAGFNAIIGHEQIIAHLSSSMKNNKISHKNL